MKYGVKVFFYTTVIVFIFLLSGSLIKSQGSNQTTQTNIQIPYTNNPPLLTDAIPNQTWAKNTNLTNAFNLNNHFTDNETITFSYTPVENITIIINQTSNGNFVSFHPDINFTGIRTVTFTASDNLYTSNSNLVYLNVTVDNMPPQWSDPEKNRDEVYQNLYVVFSALWTDNIMLKNYRFHMKENSTWTHYEEIPVNTNETLSEYGVQIRADEGTQVLWYFSAKDTSENENSTAIQNFTVLTAPTTTQNESRSSGGSRRGLGEILEKQIEKIKSFKVYPTKPFKIDLKQGQTSTISIKITNVGNQKLKMNVSLDDLENFETTLSEKNFDLDLEESKTVVIDIKAGKYLNPDIYGGYIVVSSGSEELEIPVIIQVNKLITDYAMFLEIYEESKEVRPTEIVFANFTLMNLEDVSNSKVELYYAIRDYNGLLISFKNENFTLDKKIYNTNISLPTYKESPIGEYILYARAIIGKEIILASDTFEIGERFNLKTFVKTNLLLIILIIILIAILVFIIKYRRNRERLRLLNLYVMIKEMKTFLQDNKIDEAIETYVKIKRFYGEKVSKISSKEDLKKEIEQFLKNTPLPTIKKEKTDEKEEKKSEEKPKQDEKPKDNKENKPESPKENALKEGK